VVGSVVGRTKVIGAEKLVGSRLLLQQLKGNGQCSWGRFEQHSAL